MEFFRGEKLRNVGLIPDMAASRYGDRTVFFFRGEEQSFNELSERSNKVANAITELGIKPDERVCLYIPNSIQFPEAIFGIIKTGAVPVPLNLRMPPRTLSWVVKNSDAETIVASSIETSVSSPNRAKELAEDSGIERLILPGESGDGVVDYSKIIDDASPEFELPLRKYEDVAVQFYTSGTTGRPKGVPLTHENVLSCIEGYAQISAAEPDYRLLHVLPLYHVYGLTAVLGTCLYRGGSLVFLAEPDADKILRSIDEYECNSFTGVPALFNMMLLQYQQSPEEYDLGSLEEVICAAAPLAESARRTIKNEWKVRFAEGFGLTETSPAGSLNPGNMPKGAGCIGWPHPNLEMKIVDPETKEPIVPWDNIAPWGDLEEEHLDAQGELAVRGPVVFEGYYKMPEKNEEIFDDEGWFYTGDIMRIDEDKALWMVERADDMIISGGENIYPAEVEDALMEHPDIVEAAVVPAPHKVKGEAPVAFVVQRPGADLTEEEIREFSLERVATYAHPRRVFFKDSLPKSGALKTQRFKLEREAKEKLPEPLGRK